MDPRPSFNISNNVAHANSQQTIVTYYDPNGHNASVRACLRALDCPDVDAVRTEIHSVDGVIRECIDWIFQDDRFRHWKEQEGNAVLWIYGSPGKGKTRMAAGIVDELRKETGNSSINGLTGFFFCRSTDDRMNNAVDVLKGIIRTLWEQQQSLKEHVHHNWIEEEQKFDEDFNKVASLWNLLEKMTKHIGHQRVPIVIDAIDECSEHVEHLLRLIHTAGLISPPNVKWLITSRPLGLSLQGVVLSCHQPMQVDLDSLTIQVEDAVQNYIKVKTGWMELSRFSVDDQAQIRELLLTRSESTFLWVAFVCQEVRNLPAAEAIRVISAMPKGLHHLYDKNMRLLDKACHDSNEFAIDYRNFVWTLFNLSGSPHLLELATLAGLSREKASDESYLIRVVRECNIFMVLTDSDAVRLDHKSVEDYLRELQLEKSQLIKPPTYGTLSRRCIQVLQRSLHRNLTELPELDSEAKEARTELRTRFFSIAGYSCTHWIEHVIKDGISEPITLHIFLRRHLLHWLEAISILDRYRTCLDHLSHLDTTLEALSDDQHAKSSGSPSTAHMSMTELHQFVRNVREFAVEKRTFVERWPLQVYCGASMFFTSNGLEKRKRNVVKPVRNLRHWMAGHHVRHSKPSVNVDGEYLVTSSPGTIRVWRLEEPNQFIELSCENTLPTRDLKIVIEGNQVRASWKSLVVTPGFDFVFHSATWNLDSGKLTDEDPYSTAESIIREVLQLVSR